MRSVRVQNFRNTNYQVFIFCVYLPYYAPHIITILKMLIIDVFSLHTLQFFNARIRFFCSARSSLDYFISGIQWLSVKAIARRNRQYQRKKLEEIFKINNRLFYLVFLYL